MKNAPYLAAIDYSKRILEIGPLANPLVPKEKGPDIYYADIRPTEEIKKFYAKDPSVDCESIQKIDFVISDSYHAATIDRGLPKFDYVVGSHIIEHIPLLLRFFHDMSTVLVEKGRLCLTIPDHRYCFDHYRVPTSFAELYDIDVHGMKRLSARVLDFMMNTSHNDPKKYWHMKIDDEINSLVDLSKKSFEYAKKSYEKVLAGEYVDVHFSVFTTISFLRLIFDTIRANMLPFKVGAVFPTLPNTFEFHAVLVKDEQMISDPTIRNDELKRILLIINKIMIFESKLLQLNP